jgi:hypothetical protein
MEICYIYTYDNSIMKPTKYCLKGEEKGEGELEYNGEGELLLTLYTCMELA